MLARAVEAAGIPTAIVTMMPDIAERYHLPRIVGVEFPFGHPFGQPHDPDTQRQMARAALELYGREDLPARIDVPIEWPVDVAAAIEQWRPEEEAPILRWRREKAREEALRRRGVAG